MKNCTRCGYIKEKSAFSIDRQKNDGLRMWCKSCVREHRQINAAAVAASKKRYEEANKEKVSEREKAYRAANRERILSRQREYDAANREKIAARTAKYYAEHPEKKWINSYQGRANRIGISPIIEQFTKLDVIQSYGDSCFYCAHGKFVELDHYIPISAGGAHSLLNVRPSCRSCNNAKSNRDREAAKAYRDSMKENQGRTTSG